MLYKRAVELSCRLFISYIGVFLPKFFRANFHRKIINLKIVRKIFGFLLSESEGCIIFSEFNNGRDKSLCVNVVLPCGRGFGLLCNLFIE
jgi:hypothetical protein